MNQYESGFRRGKGLTSDVRFPGEGIVVRTITLSDGDGNAILRSLVIPIVLPSQPVQGTIDLAEIALTRMDLLVFLP